MRYVLFEWTTTVQNSKYVEIPDSVDLMDDDNDLPNALGEIEDDSAFDGCERSDITWKEITDEKSMEYSTAVMNAEEFLYDT